ncbi:MAG: hypothetical protein ABL971_06160 [Vicinamibacterales bacterium]
MLMMPGVLTGLAIVALGQPIRPRFFFLSGAAAIFVGAGSAPRLRRLRRPA